MNDADDHGGSPACFGHLMAGGGAVDPETARDVARFRTAERARLVAERALPSDRRKKVSSTLAAGLDRMVAPKPGMTIAVYWPIRGEPDLRGWMASAHEKGVRIALPVVVEKNQPLEFHEWSPGCKMKRGFWNILVPEDGAEVVPDVVVSPLVGVDDELYRLGNGGGYYDRTLAALQPRPLVIGVGLSNCRLKTIFPMPWDIPMDRVLLSDGTNQIR